MRDLNARAHSKAPGLSRVGGCPLTRLTMSSRPIQNLSDCTIGNSEHLRGYRNYARPPDDRLGLSIFAMSELGRPSTSCWGKFLFTRMRSGRQHITIPQRAFAFARTGLEPWARVPAR